MSQGIPAHLRKWTEKEGTKWAKTSPPGCANAQPVLWHPISGTSIHSPKTHLVSLVWWHPCWIGIRCSPLGGSTLAGGPLWRVRRCLRGPLCSRGICGGSALVAASARSCCCCCHRGGTRAVRVHGPMLPTGGTTPHLGTWRALGGLRPWLCPL